MQKVRLLGWDHHPHWKMAREAIAQMKRLAFDFRDAARGPGASQVDPSLGDHQVDRESQPHHGVPCLGKRCAKRRHHQQRQQHSKCRDAQSNGEQPNHPFAVLGNLPLANPHVAHHQRDEEQKTGEYYPHT